MDKSHSITKQGIRVTVTDFSGYDNFIKACQATSGKKIDKSKVMNLCNRMYLAEHSPIRERVFWITVDNVPTFVANHFARHHEGINQFHRTHRSDRTGIKDEDQNRLTPTHFEFSANAQALINMSRRRLCSRAAASTRIVMRMIRDCMTNVDIGLANCMVPDCVYRGNVCYEMESCGLHKDYKTWLYDREEE